MGKGHLFSQTISKYKKIEKEAGSTITAVSQPRPGAIPALNRVTSSGLRRIGRPVGHRAGCSALYACTCSVCSVK